MNGSDSWTTMGCPCLRALRACSTTPKSPAPRSLSPPKLCADGLIYNFAYKISRRTLRRRSRVLWDPPPHGAPRPGNPGHFEGAFLHLDMGENIGLPDGHFFISRGAPLWAARVRAYAMRVCRVRCHRRQGIWKGWLLGATASWASCFFRVGVSSATTGKSCATEGVG